MPSVTISIALEDHLREFVERMVATGRYGSTSDVIKAGLRLLEEQKERNDALSIGQREIKLF